MDMYITLRLGLFLILNGNRLSDATCSLPTDLKNAAWEYNYTKVSDSTEQSTTLSIATTTLQNSAINLNAFGTTINDWTCINSLNISNTQTIVVFKSDTSFTSGPSSGNRRLYLCMKLTKVTKDLYFFYFLSDISNVVTPNERVFASEGGNAPADDAPMCSTFCKYAGSPKIRTLRRKGTSDEVPGDAALCEPCDNTCEVDRCDPNPCQNNGSCTDFKDTYNCTCATGWKGENCTTDINECSYQHLKRSLCQLHSDCYNLEGSYRCDCRQGYQDNNGDCTDVNECERKPCPEHSNCTNTNGSFTCACWIGYVNTSMGCQEDEVSMKEKLKDSESKIALPIGITVLLVVLCIVVAFLLWKKYTRQSNFEVTKRNSNTSSDDHKNGKNELKEVEQKLVVKTESDEIEKSRGQDIQNFSVEQETVDKQHDANSETANKQHSEGDRQSAANETVNNSA